MSRTAWSVGGESRQFLRLPQRPEPLVVYHVSGPRRFQMECAGCSPQCQGETPKFIQEMCAVYDVGIIATTV